MAKFLTKQVGFYSEQVEPWKKEHDEAMARYDCADELSEIASYGLFVLDNLLRSCESGACEKSFDHVVALKAILEQWHETSIRVVEFREEELEGYEVGGIDKLQEGINSAEAMLLELDDAETAINSVRNGLAISKESFLDELRSQIHR